MDDCFSLAGADRFQSHTQPLKNSLYLIFSGFCKEFSIKYEEKNCRVLYNEINELTKFIVALTIIVRRVGSEGCYDRQYQ